MSAKNVAERAKDPLVEQFKKLDTPCVSDAMDRLGMAAGCLGLASVVPGVKIVGRAFTVKYRVTGEVERGTVGDFLDDVAPGQVVVIDNAGRVDCTVWGDIMTIVADRKGIAGTVIDGVCRDVPKIRELGYPLFSRGWYMMTGKDRVEVDSVNTPVSISARQVRPGDIVLADDSGVVVIPASRAEEILKIATDIEAVERKIVKLVEKGLSLREARNNLEYHSLQTRSKQVDQAAIPQSDPAI
jgi:4-hydroxy-4-methyl-2-oxoglutarate aldolase